MARTLGVLQVASFCNISQFALALFWTALEGQIYTVGEKVIRLDPATWTAQQIGQVKVLGVKQIGTDIFSN